MIYIEDMKYYATLLRNIEECNVIKRDDLHNMSLEYPIFCSREQDP